MVYKNQARIEKNYSCSKNLQKQKVNMSCIKSEISENDVLFPKWHRHTRKKSDCSYQESNLSDY